ncbi:hypothetical protein [Micromonospora peucetia]|uniref:Uncharacterized protein n=1 Tax=Micromonospora peucetia TaxID=47871 RepID=A0A1C6UFT1_9ACTN|nr:hypothetical protein [Micromonospora peucetia]WSA34011.1 hypothetical protein OIE14_08195 [Micromonospora peucetia]SCL52965.1 hypothetical protein GA0070608_1100 [Micromonospora peucetia]
MSAPPRHRDGAPATLAWLGHPATVVALVLLVVNDHLLKAAFPGLLTGKLSDVAGLVLAPPLVAVLLTLLAPRLPARGAVAVGLGLVAAGFTIVKSSGYAAAVVSAAWSVVSGPSLIRADRTDLLALPALALAWWSWLRARREPVRGRSARLVRLVVLLPAATLAVAATSPVHYPDAVRAVVLGEQLAAGTSSGYDTHVFGTGWQVSDDAGATWRDPTPGEADALAGRNGLVAGPVSRSCSTATPTGCYRVVPGRLAVEQSDDAGRSWRPAWGATEAQRAVLRRQYPDPGPRGERIATQELTVRDTGDGRHVVLVANGRDGFAIRRPDGAWERLGFVDARKGGYPFDGRPPALGRSTPADRQDDLLLALALGLTLAVSVLAVSGVRVGLRRGATRWQPLPLAALGSAAWVLLATTWSDPLFTRELSLVALAAVLLPLLLLSVLAPTGLRGARRRWTLEVLLAAALTLALTALPLVGWLYGRPAYTRTAVLLAVAATVPGLLLGWRAARLVNASADPVSGAVGRGRRRGPRPGSAPRRAG